jgi:hypothetical protein
LPACLAKLPNNAGKILTATVERLSIWASLIRFTVRGAKMKYILLVHHNEDVLGSLGETNLNQMRKDSVQLANDINRSGQYLDAAPLQPVSTAVSVRVRDGKRLVTDGPFAETREQLGGYFFINADDLDQALDIAARIPGARIGTVEIRPVMEIEGLPN